MSCYSADGLLDEGIGAHVAAVLRVVRRWQFGADDGQRRDQPETMRMMSSSGSRRTSFSALAVAALIGGIRVVVGDEVLDTSVKARLEQMKVALTA